jgi:hypothetical protein
MAQIQRSGSSEMVSSRLHSGSLARISLRLITGNLCGTSRDLLAGQNLSPGDSEPIPQAMRKPQHPRDENLNDFSYDEY